MGARAAIRISVHSAVCLLSFWFGLRAQTIPAVTTYHNDNYRSGSNQSETQLTPANVSAGSFGKLFSAPVDAAVYAQPLYVPGLTIKGAVHNVVFIATENNSVYAYDADVAGPPLWQINFNYGAPGATVTPVPNADVNCGDLQPVIGITSTPVIDLATNTLYAVAKTKEVSASGASYYQRLHGVSVITGAESFPAVTITASVPGICGNVQNGNVVFDPLTQHQRAALLELNGFVYIASASHCDQGPYSGWLIGYDTRSLAQVAAFNTTPDDSTGYCKGGIWQSGGGPSADTFGNIFALTGNGGFNANLGGASYGNSLLKLSTSVTGAVSVKDYFTPYNQMLLNQGDLDFGGSGTAVVIDDQAGPYPHIVVGSGKAGTIYVMNRDSLGGYDGSTDKIIQVLPSAIGNGQTAYPPPVNWQDKVYFGAAFDHLKGFQLSNGQFNPVPFAAGSNSFGDLGAGLSISSTPAGGNGIIWALEGTGNGVLHAYNALTLTELYNTSLATGGQDSPGNPVKFSVPTVANGKVYVGTQSSVSVYGLLSGASQAAFGSIDTPLNQATGLAGALSVTGWALSRGGVQSVAIWRAPVGAEVPGGNGLVFIEDATIVPGSRPDVAQAYPGYPCNDCGWGAQVLTNELPDSSGAPMLGNGTYVLHILVTTTGGTTNDIGSVTVTVDNTTSPLPFGTIDTPAQGGTASGPAFVNFGWALTPQPNLIPIDGSTITVFIDGKPVGHPVYNQPRSDIQALFPGYQNSQGAVGYFFIDTTQLTNGLHTLAWSATDSAGHAQGLGSRYFNVQNVP